jgi:hypothetical protein
MLMLKRENDHTAEKFTQSTQLALCGGFTNRRKTPGPQLRRTYINRLPCSMQSRPILMLLLFMSLLYHSRKAYCLANRPLSMAFSLLYFSAKRYPGFC